MWCWLFNSLHIIVNIHRLNKTMESRTCYIYIVLQVSWKACFRLQINCTIRNSKNWIQCHTLINYQFWDSHKQSQLGEKNSHDSSSVRWILLWFRNRCVMAYQAGWVVDYYASPPGGQKCIYSTLHPHALSSIYVKRGCFTWRYIYNEVKTRVPWHMRCCNKQRYYFNYPSFIWIFQISSGITQ